MNTLYKDIEIEVAEATEFLNKLKSAKKNDKVFDLAFIENSDPSRLITTPELLKGVNEISPNTFFVHWDRNGMNKTYAHQRDASPIKHSYALAGPRDLNDVDSFLETTINKDQERILYIGPEDGDYRNRVYRTANSPRLNSTNLIFEHFTAYSPEIIQALIKKAASEGLPYTKIVIEETGRLKK